MSAHQGMTVGVASVVFVAACGITISTVSAVSRAVLGRMGYSAADTRLVTGLIVTGTAQRPRLYVASSDPRVGGAASGGSPTGDTNSGVISQVDWTGTGWERRDIVRSLPRSRSNHATNGLALSADAKTLNVAQGSNTNKGAPSEEFGGLAEYALSGAILAVDLARIEGTYDIPTLQGRGPFGGRGGRNQGRLVPGGPVAVFAPGFRNPYDVVVTQSGRIYTIQNGANPGWGIRRKAMVPVGAARTSREPVEHATPTRCTSSRRAHTAATRTPREETAPTPSAMGVHRSRPPIRPSASTCHLPNALPWRRSMPRRTVSPSTRHRTPTALCAATCSPRASTAGCTGSSSTCAVSASSPVRGSQSSVPPST